MEIKKMKATFAGGCFWCMQLPFQQTKGVLEAISGYAGGSTVNPTYREVSSGTTGHLESVQIIYDPEKISYDNLLDVFWTQIDPTDKDGQFADRGSQYQTAIFYHDEDQKQIAEASKEKINNSGKFKRPVATEIRPYTTFYPAEEYHQDYAIKNPLEYYSYKRNSGREGYIEKTWSTKNMIHIYSTPTCHHCREIKEFLNEKNLEFEEIDMASNEEARTMIIEKTGHLGAPIVQIGDEFIFGYDRKKMENLLK